VHFGTKIKEAGKEMHREKREDQETNQTGLAWGDLEIAHLFRDYIGILGDF
jgi:hypothetical protein